ncbi:HET-domain-containing protein [Lentithecium fluviatile CBS 122367]|uniref:HET-domain-containing protein n=1 Tax=Lentithecium fluviatile CBS 122367 TaxID=1168545 RepID=A0A6G1IMI7_9PLEO|nr:HET-domain-containing protein [Lentithecium fluviatile CBS 122367]
MEFTSRLCSVCDNALRLAFTTLQNRTPEIFDKVPHHATKDSLVESVLVRSCHLCRLIVYHLKLHWSKDYSLPKEEEQPTSLTEDDFKDSDFVRKNFPAYRVGLREYMLGLPEDVGFTLEMREFGNGEDGVLGTVELDCKTFEGDSLRANQPRFWIFAAQGFNLQDLPKTFRDAIEIAGWANVRYIWIDSCCIIQGSKSDWEKEAKMMEKVYKNTYFNISADHSPNSAGGCFIDRLAYKLTPVQYTIPTSVSGVGQSVEIFLLSRHNFMRALKESPIAERAWVIQERFLSPRILHFTEEQVFWECGSLCACETFPLGVPWVFDHTSSWQYRASTSTLTPRNQTPTPKRQREKPDDFKIWGSICVDYSRTRLTYLSDKLIAFSGMARGMWKGDLESSLLWTVTALDGRPIRPNGSREAYAAPYITAEWAERYRAPSWSWLSKDCGLFWSRVPNSPRLLIEMLDVRVDLVNDDEPTDEIRGGTVTVRGMLRAASWIQDGSKDFVVLDEKHGDSFREKTELPGSFLLQRDTGDAFPVQDIFCLPVRQGNSTRQNSLGKVEIQGLVLEEAGEEGRYRRLGYFDAIGKTYSASELERPWDSIEFPNFGEEKSDAEMDKAKRENIGRLDSFMVDGKFNQGLFRKVQEKTVTIV